MEYLFIILAYDAYLYWIHRFMHKYLMDIHSVHHRRYNRPVEFHPVEMVLLFWPIVALWFTKFWILGVVFIFTSTFTTTRLHKAWLFKNFGRECSWAFWTTPDEHLGHHNNPNSNYGTFFMFWDRILGTYRRI